MYIAIVCAFAPLLTRQAHIIHSPSSSLIYAALCLIQCVIWSIISTFLLNTAQLRTSLTAHSKSGHIHCYTRSFLPENETSALSTSPLLLRCLVCTTITAMIQTVIGLNSFRVSTVYYTLWLVLRLTTTYVIYTNRDWGFYCLLLIQLGWWLIHCISFHSKILVMPTLSTDY
jgi:hypothetical protein